MTANASNEETEKNANMAATSCNTNSTFNFSVGIVAIIAAVVIGYVVYRYCIRG
jgi:hypothetical protein